MSLQAAGLWSSSGKLATLFPPVRFLTVLLFTLPLLLGACRSAGPAAAPTRADTPRLIDPSASGPAVALARDLYPPLARAANAFDRNDIAAGRQPLGEAAERCSVAMDSLRFGPPDETADQRRRRHLVIGACHYLELPRTDGGSVDRALALFALALAPDGAPLLPASQR